MPKTTESISSKRRRYANGSDGVFTVQTDQKTNREVLFCQCCYTNVNCDQKSHFDQHVKSALHQKKLRSFKGKLVSVDQLIHNSQQDFNSDLCQLLVCLNIPFDRLSHPIANQFFEKYVKYRTPDPSTLRKYNMDPIYDKTIDKIRNELKDEYIWIQIDESTDRKNHKVVHTIIGSMNIEKNQCKKFLMDMVWVESANSTTISQSLNTALTRLWPDGIKYDKVLAIITDGARYMLKAAKSLKNLYPKMIHIRCLAHSLHNIVEHLMLIYKNVNRFISCAKKVFRKAPSRVELFKKTCPSIPLPPEPVKTRWGSWLNGIEYMAKHFDDFKSVIDLLDSKDSIHIQEIKKLFEKVNLKSDITFINTYFRCIAIALKKLEISGLSLKDSISIVDEVYDSLSDTLAIDNPTLMKMKTLIDNNFGLQTVKQISAIINGKDVPNPEIELTPHEMSCFRWCPIVNTDVERSFSRYKWILNDRRLSFGEQNLKKYIVINCNIANLD